MQGMSNPDQQVVTDALTAGKFSNVHTMWDRLHQGFLNHLILLRMMKTTFAQDEMFGQYIKADEVFYHGISQGGIMGPVILATSPDIERGALGVMGQAYSFLLFRSVDFDQFLAVIHLFYPDYRMNQLLIGMAQMLWDRVEPNGYSHHVTENPLPGVNEKEVLMRVAIGDHQVTTFAGHVMARTMKAPHLTTVDPRARLHHRLHKREIRRGHTRLGGADRMSGLETELRDDLVQHLRPRFDLQDVTGPQLLIHERTGKALLAADEIDDDEVELAGCIVQLGQGLANVRAVFR